MTKSQKRGLRFKAELTVFLSLVFLLMISLVMALLTSASQQVKKSSQRAQMTLALENVFAEYDQKMLEQYDLFVRADCDESMIEKRLQYYGITDTDHRVTKSEYLTDNQGLPYYQQAVRYMKNWLGLDGTIGGNSSDFVSDSSLEDLETQTESSLLEMLSEDENNLLEDGNPLSNIQSLKQTSLLSILVSDTENLSHRSISTENLPSVRVLNEGSGGFSDSDGEGGYAEKVCFVAYLFEHFSDASEERNLNALSYELEYILCGKSVDSENLEAALQKILKIRWAVNYAYLLTDTTKKAEAEAMALTLCSLLTVPGVTEVVKQAILLAWAYGESIVDLRVLMEQDKVPLLKTSATWQLQLANLAKLGTSEEISGARSSETGLDYSDYLKGLLLLESRESLSMRSLDLIESNLSVQMDMCMTRVEVESEYQLRENVWDKFQTAFQYQ